MNKVHKYPQIIRILCKNHNSILNMCKAPDNIIFKVFKNSVLKYIYHIYFIFFLIYLMSLHVSLYEME